MRKRPLKCGRAKGKHKAKRLASHYASTDFITDQTVVLYAGQQQSTATHYVSFLRHEGIIGHPVLCRDRSSISTSDYSQYNCMDLLVDEDMYNILMEDGRVPEEVHVIFRELAKCGGEIHIINILPPGGNRIDFLFNQIPASVRKLNEDFQNVIEESTQSEASGMRGDTAMDSKSAGRLSGNQTIKTTGISGGAARNSNVAGHVTGNQSITYNYILHEDVFKSMKENDEFVTRKIESMVKVTRENKESTEPNKVKITLEFSEEFKHIIEDIVKSNLSQAEGVVETEVCIGSIIILLTLADNYFITEAWIQDVLGALFNKKIVSCVSDGDTFKVTVQRHMYILQNEVPDLDMLYWKSRFHENCVPKPEYDTETLNLKATIGKLERDLKTIQEEQMTEAKVWLQVKLRSTEDETSSGLGTAESSLADIDTETDRQKDTEETLPAESSHWDIKEGDMRLIISNRNDMFNEACRTGKVDIVRGLLSAGHVDINNGSEGGLTPVMIAAWNGHQELFHVLVKNGSDLSVVLDNGNNILHVACFGGNVDIVEYVITSKAVDIESRGMYGRTAVMKAATTGQGEVFESLVKWGSDLSGVDNNGNNILHLASFSDNVEIVKYIINHNIAAVDSKSAFGRTAVMFAAGKGKKKVFEYLVSIGADLSGVDNTGNNILHLACFSDNVEFVKYIINHNIAAVDSKGEFGRTRVMFAAERGQKKVFDYLVSTGADLSGVDNTGNNILHLACFSDNVEIVKYIINHNIAAVDSKGMFGRTPVMTGAEKGQKKVFDYLVSIGADLSGVDNGGNNILHLACFSDNVDIVKHIINHNIAAVDSKGIFGRTPVMTAAEKGQKKVFEYLVSIGADLSVVDNGGNNILHLACFSDNVEFVKHIINHNIAAVDSKGAFGRTAVMKAAGKGQKKVFEYLVSMGSDLSGVDNDGNNILHLACFSDNVEIVKYIINHNIAAVDSKGQFGRTGVMNAAEQGQKKVFEYLVSIGADLSGVDNDGNNILHVACFSDNVEIVKYIINHNIAAVDSEGAYGRTAVMKAAEKGQKKVFGYLLSVGADLSVVDSCGLNILDLAAMGGNVSIVDQILTDQKVDINTRDSQNRTPLYYARKHKQNRVVELLVEKGATD